MAAPVTLSKTRFLSGCQCPLRLWYDVHRRDLASAPDEAQRARFDVGHQVGRLARQRWPGGELVEEPPWKAREALEKTRALMADESLPAIYEAAIAHGGAMTRVDVLVRAPGGAWDLVEVKSGTRVKEPHDLDVAVQYWILRGAGLSVRRAGVLVLNRDYVYPGGDPDLDELFRFEDLVEACEERLDEIGDKLEELHNVAASPDAPDIPIGDHCFTPYECPYYAWCSRDVAFPRNPLSILPKLTGWRLEGLREQGIDAVDDIPADYPLTDRQARVRECTVTGEPWKSPELRDELDAVEWPLCALDFEAAQFAIPRFPGTRPYDAIPFQFSCHRQDQSNGAVIHHEFLATNAEDPREPLARALLDALGDSGSILVYSSYESRVIGELARALPSLENELMALKPRLVDLHRIVESHYCHPDFQGSWSIKAVLPVLVPGMNYEGMTISDGEAAARSWIRMIDTADWVEKDELAAALKEYCAQDSLAMLKLREALLGL